MRIILRFVLQTLSWKKDVFHIRLNSLGHTLDSVVKQRSAKQCQLFFCRLKTMTFGVKKLIFDLRNIMYSCFSVTIIKP